MKSLFLVGFVLAVSSANKVNISPRISGGLSIDNFSRFPHHVSIYTDDHATPCSASIISDEWLLTSNSCVKWGTTHQLDFHRLYQNQMIDSFSLIIDQSAIVPYPNGFDDIALVRLPIKLKFSASLKPIKLELKERNLKNLFAFMPGFSIDIDSEGDELHYGMFQIIGKEGCEQNFDEYLQICAKDTGFKGHVNCEGDLGSGLLVDWPRNSRLVGVFSNGGCESKTHVYIKVSQYIDWIESVTGMVLEE